MFSSARIRLAHTRLAQVIFKLAVPCARMTRKIVKRSTFFVPYYHVFYKKFTSFLIKRAKLNLSSKTLKLRKMSENVSTKS